MDESQDPRPGRGGRGQQRSDAGHFYTPPAGTVYVRIVGEARLGAELDLIVEFSDRRVSAPRVSRARPRAVTEPHAFGLPQALRAWLPLREGVRVPLTPPGSRPLTARQREQLWDAFRRRHPRMSGEEAYALNFIEENFRLPNPEHYVPERARALRRTLGLPSPVPEPPPQQNPPPRLILEPSLGSPPGRLFEVAARTIDTPGAQPQHHLDLPAVGMIPHARLNIPHPHPLHPVQLPIVPLEPHFPMPFVPSGDMVPFRAPPLPVRPWSYLPLAGMQMPGPELGVPRTPRAGSQSRQSSTASAGAWSPPHQRPRPMGQ